LSAQARRRDPASTDEQPPAIELDPRARAFLEGPRYAVLATVNADGSPHLTEMWYELRGNDIVFNTTAERMKRRNLERDPRAAVLVSTERGGPVWAKTEYVRVDGAVRQIADGAAAREDIRRLAIRYDGPEEAERGMRDTWSKQDRVTYALTPRRVYLKGL